MRRSSLTLLAACWTSSAPVAPQTTSPGFVVEQLFEIRPNAPVIDLKWTGVDSRVGGYRIGRCIVGYDAGMYQSGLEPYGLDDPEDYRYRARPIGTTPARWATWKKLGDPQQPGPYWAAVYVRGLTISAACEDIAARDAALAMLETITLTGRRRSDLAGVDPSRGPADFAPAPNLCTITYGAPTGGFGNGIVRVEVVGSYDVIVTDLVGESYQDTQVTNTTQPELDAPPGTYTLNVHANGEQHARCKNVEVAAGRVTTVEIARFRL